MVVHREEESLYNKKPSYGVLWKHSSLALQNSIRGTIDYTQMSESDDARQLWGNVKRLCTVGVVTKANPGKVQRDADFRFSRVHQYANQSVPGFYDRYLQDGVQNPRTRLSSQRSS